MVHRDPEPISPFTIRAADALAVAVNQLVKREILDSRSEAADALLNYASERFGDRDPIGDLERHVEGTVQPPQQR